MDTKKYAIFERIISTGSLTKAGEEFEMTQSGVSHVLNDLERAFRMRLLIRNRSGIRLTPEGEEILGGIRKILEAEAELESIAEKLKGRRSGTIRIGTFSSVAVQWLPGMMKAFEEQYPETSFRLYNGDYHDVERWVAEKEVDLAFVTLPIRAVCSTIPLMEDPLLAVLPPGHRLAKKKICPADELADEPFISLLANSDDDERRAMEAVGLKPKVRFSTKDDYAIIAMVEEGLGISIMPELLLKGRKDNVVLRPLDPPSSRVIALAIPEPDTLGGLAGKFADFAEVWVRKLSESEAVRK